MLKKLNVDELEVGMCVIRTDRSWQGTARVAQRMVISSSDQITRLKGQGVRQVEVETTSGADLSLDAVEEEVKEQPTAAAYDYLDAEPFPIPRSDTEEAPVAKQAYREAKTIIQTAMTDIRMGRDINTDACAAVVTNMADSILRNGHALTSLSRLKSFDQYTFFHSVNTTILALTLGRSMNMTRSQLQVLGMGALLHDIGKMRIPLEILNKPGRLGPDEFRIMKTHPLRGAELIAAQNGLCQECIAPVLEHHERINGSGYPHQKTGPDLTLYGTLTSVVDIYDAVTSDRVYHKAMLPFQALRMLYDLAQHQHVDLTLVEQFVTCIGLYPVGSCVELSSGEVGIVSRISPDQLKLPVVTLIRDNINRPYVPPRILDLAKPTDPPKSITAILDPRNLGINPAIYLSTGPVEEPQENAAPNPLA